MREITAKYIVASELESTMKQMFTELLTLLLGKLTPDYVSKIDVIIQRFTVEFADELDARFTDTELLLATEWQKSPVAAKIRALEPFARKLSERISTEVFQNHG